MKRAGFSLIELMISLVIAGMLSAALMTLIVQISGIQERLTIMTSIYGRIAVVQNQMERDIMGAFIPAQVDLLQTSTEKKEQQKPLDKIFYATSKEGGRFELLTCITSSPLEIFFGVKNAQLKPRVARVVYRLVPDTQRKNSFVLMRQEGFSDLYFDKYNQDATGQLRSYALIDGIQHMTVDYITIEQTTPKGDEKPKRTYVKKPGSWDSAPKEESAKESQEKKMGLKKEPIKLPNQAIFKLVLWNPSYTATKEFTYTIPIAYKASEYEMPPASKEPEEKEPAEGKKEETKKVGA